jgi:hypothetical protein
MSQILSNLLTEVGTMFPNQPDVSSKVREMLYEAYADGMADGYCDAKEDAKV